MLKANTKVGLIFFPAFDWSISPTHPERQERLLYTMDQLQEEGIFDIKGIEVFNPQLASSQDIERVHLCYPDVEARVPKSHLISAGGIIQAAETVLTGKTQKSFALVRPPGHHAHRVVYGDRGFCIINNVAVMLENIRQKFGNKKVAIIDTDCHHGDGTQDIYWNDKNTLFISFHQDGRTLYPGTGFLDELGGPGAYGYNINIPLPPNTGEEGFLYVIDNVVLPILSDFQPDLIINCAGQDNHYTDPITNMKFTALGYAKLTEKLNPDIVILEGGYSIEGALPYINLGIVLALAGIDYHKVQEMDYNPDKLKQAPHITQLIKKTCAKAYNNWTNQEQKSYNLFKGQEHIIRHKEIFYDTIGVMEYQTEKISVCPHCSGLIILDSITDKGHQLLAVIIPRDGCSLCLNKGYKTYKDADSKDYSQIYLQDKFNDVFYKR